MKREKPGEPTSTIIGVLRDPDSSLFESAWSDLKDPVDLEGLRRVVRLSKDLDRLRAKVKSLVTEIAEFALCSHEEVVEHLSDIARAGSSSVGFYNTFLYAMKDHAGIEDPRGVLLEVTGVGSKESLRTQIFDAKKAVEASTRGRSTSTRGRSTS